MYNPLKQAGIQNHYNINFIYSQYEIALKIA